MAAVGDERRIRLNAMWFSVESWNWNEDGNAIGGGRWQGCVPKAAVRSSQREGSRAVRCSEIATQRAMWALVIVVVEVRVRQVPVYAV